MALNLEHQRKRAKQLRRGHGEGNAAAAQRIARHLPRLAGAPADRVLASRFTLSEAQLVVAREAGFASWPALRRALDAAPDLGDAILDAALAGDDRAADALLARAPALPRGSLAVAAALADPAALALLDEAPGLADHRAAARGWTPLLYLCCSRYRRTDPAAAAARLAIARRLIACGADVNAVGVEPGFTSAHVTMFDDHRWRPIEGAAGRVASAALVGALLDAGADLAPTSAVLAQAVIGGDVAVLARLLAAAPPWWQVIWALKACAVYDRVAHARLLDPHVHLPASREPGLREAIRRGHGRELLEVLLGPGEPRDLVAPVWRTAYRDAVRHDNRAARALLEASGLSDTDLAPVDRLIADCWADHLDTNEGGGQGLDGQRGSAKPRAAQGEVRGLRTEDHRVLAWAIANRRERAVPRLLAAGLDPSVADADGETPLHRAVMVASPAMIEALLVAGAAPDARDFDGKTPLELARAIADPAVRMPIVARLLAAGADPARMSRLDPEDAGGDAAGGDADTEALRRAGAVEREDPEQLFERAADAVAAGELEVLREMLDDEPDLVHARSPRPHRATLLHYCAANGTEDPRQRTPPNAPAIAQLLVDRGADPNAACKLYGGADVMGLLLTSAIPRAAGVDGELAAVLARAGARVDTVDGQGPLVTAILHGAPRAAAALADAGAPVDTLLAAAGLGRVAVLEELVARGAEVNARFRDGATALHAAAATGAARAVDWLLAHGADPTLREERWGATPHGMASYYGHAAIAATLAAAVGGDGYQEPHPPSATDPS